MVFGGPGGEVAMIIKPAGHPIEATEPDLDASGPQLYDLSDRSNERAKRELSPKLKTL